MEEDRHGAAVKHIPLDGATLERLALKCRQVLQPRRKQRLDRGRYLDFARLTRKCEELLKKQWVAFARRDNPLARRGRKLLPQPADQLLTCGAGEWLDPQDRGARPWLRGGARVLRKLIPGRAGGQNRGVGV